MSVAIRIDDELYKEACLQEVNKKLFERFPSEHSKMEVDHNFSPLSDENVLGEKR